GIPALLRLSAASALVLATQKLGSITGRGTSGAPGTHARATPTRDLPSAGREDARRLLHRRLLQSRAGDARARRPPSPGRPAGLPEERRPSRRSGRGDRNLEAVLARLGRPHRARALRGRPPRASG